MLAPYIIFPLAGRSVGGSIGKSFGYNKKDKKRKEIIGRSIGSFLGVAGAIGLDVASRRHFKAYRGYGGGYGRSHSTSHNYSSLDEDMLDLLRKSRTKVQANAIRKEHIMKHHPDKGGSVEKAQKVNVTWDHFKKSGQFDKLAYLRSVTINSFNEELEKICK